MRVCFLVVELGLGGGTHLILGYARSVAALGHEVDLVAVAPRPQLLADAGDMPVRRLKDVADIEYKVAIGTWWTTAPALFEVRAERRIAFLQNLDSRFYREEEFFERLGATGLWTAPVDFIVSGQWMARMLDRFGPMPACV